MKSVKPLGLKLLASLVVIAMVVAACSEDSLDDDTTTTGDDVTTSGPPDEGDDGDEAVESVAGFDTYTLGIFGDVTTDNPWSYLDSSGNDVWVGYVLGPTLGQPYDIGLPGLEVAPDLAAGELEPVVQEGDSWVGTITLRDDIVWSDGEAITAQDYVFTYETARDFDLTANWTDYLNAATEGTPGVTGVEAIDDQTVEVTFNSAPGLAEWGVGKGPPFMPILPEHFWGPVVEKAAATEAARDTLISASGVGAPSAGPTVFSEIQEGGLAVTTANANYTHAGETVESGGVTYEVGPFAANFNYQVYSGQHGAVLALANGEVDLLLNPLGMQRDLRDRVSNHEDLTAVVNRTNGYRFLAFNHSRAPMDDPAFRDALTAMINKEELTERLLPGGAFPLYVLLPESNEAWYDEEVAEELADAGYAGLDDDTRRSIAISLLTDAGYIWPDDQAPGWYADTDDDPETPDEYSPEPVAGFSFAAAAGDLVGPDGDTIQPLELIHPNADHDPLRAIAGGYVAGVAREIGIPVSSLPTDFDQIIDIVFEFDEETASYTSPFDMFILGFHSVGDPMFPTFHGSFFGTGGDSNNTQYASDEFDAVVEQFDSAPTVEAAYGAMWEMERLIARDKPHVPLFDSGILEFYNNRVKFPFTDSLSGLQFANGFPDVVTAP